MFDKVKFAQILKKINETYSSQRDFSKKSEINRTYLSQYMNMKLDNPPKPNILKKLADYSNNITSYNELMTICGYTDTSLDIVFLEELRDKIEEQYLRNIINIRLSSEENEVYQSLQDILPITTFKDLNREEKVKCINSYLENIDWINEKSKSKITNKLELLIEYCNHYSEVTDEIANKKYNEIKRDYTSTNIDFNTKLNNYNSVQYYMCPVYGQISAGQPNWAEECIEGRIPIDPELMGIINPEEHFFLRVNGESMNRVIKNGAFALIHKQDYVDKDGDIAVVLVNGDNATLKHFTKKGDIVVLEPDSDVTDDPDIKTQIYDKTTPIRIIGKYVGKLEINKNK